MEIYIKPSTKELFALTVEASDSIETIKAKIETKEKLAAGEQKLISTGRLLEDGKTL